MTEPSFRNERFFLSNVYPFSPGIRTEIGNVETVEHAYQALKLKNPTHRQIVLLQQSGKTAKRICRDLIADGAPTVKDWDIYKVPIMKDLLIQKFSPDTELAQRLRQTHPETLIEHNTWGDNFCLKRQALPT